MPGKEHEPSAEGKREIRFFVRWIDRAAQQWGLPSETLVHLWKEEPWGRRLVWCCREVLLMSDALAELFGRRPNDRVLSQVLYHSSRGHWTFHAHLSAMGKESEWSKAHELDLESAREVWQAFFEAWDPWFRERYPHYFYSQREWQGLRDLEAPGLK